LTMDAKYYLFKDKEPHCSGYRILEKQTEIT
jgi:hypothetical protein